MIVPGDASGGWRFCHPLIHDAAYASLLASDRRVLHARVADRIESRAHDGRAIGMIARHRAAAGDANRAIPLLVRAAESALGLGAGAEAAAYLDLAAGLEPVGPGRDELERRAGAVRGGGIEATGVEASGVKADAGRAESSIDARPVADAVAD
jgi:hypothetical protein